MACVQYLSKVNYHNIIFTKLHLIWVLGGLGPIMYFETVAESGILFSVPNNIQIIQQQQIHAKVQCSLSYGKGTII